MKQLNITFNPVEDRLLLRMTTGKADSLAEYRIWVTRRFAHLLWSVLDRMAESDTELLDTRVAPESRETVREFQKEVAVILLNLAQLYGTEAQEIMLSNKVKTAE
jgi:hypothetical protein